MNVAETVKKAARNANDAITRAEDLDACVSQDWEDEATVFRFNDDSHLVVSGRNVYAFPDFNDVLLQFPNA